MPVTIDLAEINFRKGTALEWSTANPLLIAGEPGLETDTKLMKIGDGVTAWNSLGYMPEQLAKQIYAATSKTTPVDADVLPLSDSAASNGLKKLTWANLKATLVTYFDTLYQATGLSILKSLLTTTGDIIYASSANTPARLAAGTSGHVLTAAGAGVAPAWAAAPSPSFVGAIAYGAVNLAFSSTPTAISDLTTEIVDTDAFHDTVTNTSRMTIPSGKDGKYRMEININLASTAGMQNLYLRAYKNGVAITEGLTNGNVDTKTTGEPQDGFFRGSLLVTGVATDYFEFFILSASGAPTIDKARYSFEYRGA